MRTTSALYKTLRNESGSFYEVRVTCGNKTYELDKLKSVKSFPALFDGSGPKIGQTCSAECDVVVRELSENWPRMAEFTVELRLCSEDGTRKSEWLSMGTYYTDQRSKTEGGDLSIIAFDKMLFLETSWADKIPEALLPTSWPVTSAAMGAILEAVTGIQLDSRTVLDDTVKCWGLDTSSTAKERWGDIAAAHGGNFVITTEGKLRLVPLVNGITEQTAIAGIAIAGVAVVGTNGMEDLKADVVHIGMRCQKLRTSPKLAPITGITLETIGGEKVSVGNGTGYTLTGSCNFASTTGLGNLCLSKLQGIEYRPFEAEKAALDPAAEPGDLIAMHGGVRQAIAIQWNLGKHPHADILAPYDEEVNHEYAVQSKSTKAYRKAVANTDEKLKFYPTTVEMNSAITQSASQITLEVSRSYVTVTNYNQAIKDLQDQIDGSINSFSGPEVPTLYNYPAEEWNTDSKKQQHVGSLYLVTSDGGSEQAGQYYRFEQNGDQFGWVLVQDSALAKALADAAAAQAAADQAIADAEAAQAAADAAQGTADEAAAAAEAEAAQAYALAVAQAAIDATNLANQALAEAKAYADQQFRDFINGEYLETLEQLKEQLDQKAETYYQPDSPHLSWSNTIAGIAIAGVSVVGATWDDHKGDLWYRTTDGTTWYWTGTGWLQQNVPTEVFDRIDGKAQIFVVQPKPPYAVGDLWFNSDEDEIMTCINARASGSYTASDWEKRNKYTNDDKAIEVETDLHDNYLTTVQTRAEIKTTADTITASVLAKRGGVQTSFGWVLTDTDHTWYANNAEVMKVNKDGLTVKGVVKATSGYIGTEQAGFEITASALRNGMQSFSDNQHDGVYIGTDGIALGKGRFKVDSAGNVTASSLNISGGIINIGNKFIVDAEGNLTATNGTFAGNVYASNIQYTARDGVGGSFSGEGITQSSIEGSTTGPLASGVIDSLGYANFSHDVFNNNDVAPYVRANNVVALRNVSSLRYYVENGEASYDIKNHTHTFKEGREGEIIIEGADWTGAQHSFNIADTEFFNAAISAATVKALTANRETTDVNVVWNATDKTIGADFTLVAKNEAGDIVYRELEYPIILPASKAYTAGAQTATVSALSIDAAGTPSYSADDRKWYATASATATARGTKADGSYYTENVSFSNRQIDVTIPYNAGISAKSVTNITTYGSIGYTSKTDGGNPTYSVPVRASLNDGTYSSVFNISINGSSAYNEGLTAKYVTNISTYGAIGYTSKADGGSPTYTVPVRASLSDGTYSGAYNISVNGSSAYNEGARAEAAKYTAVTVNKRGTAVSGYLRGSAVTVNLLGSSVYRYSWGGEVSGTNLGSRCNLDLYQKYSGRYYKVSSALYYAGSSYRYNVLGSGDYYYNYGGQATYYNGGSSFQYYLDGGQETLYRKSS